MHCLYFAPRNADTAGRRHDRSASGLQVTRRWLIGAVSAMLLLAAQMPPRAGAQTVGEARVDVDVAAAVAQSGSTRVIVELKGAPLLPDERVDRGKLRVRVAAAQDAVLRSAPVADVAVRRRFAGAPGFAAEVTDAGLRRLAADPRVASIVSDRQVSLALTESAALTNADDARDIGGLTGAGFTVAVIDTGIDNDHPDLAGDVAFEVCYMLDGCPQGGTFGTGPGAAADDHGHGSHVAGIITATGVVSPRGIAPDADIGVYKVIGVGTTAYVSDLDAAMSDIIANHPEVRAVNMSLSDNTRYTGTCDSVDPTMTSAINTLRGAGTLTFAASGNNQFADGVTWPACIANAVSVGAVWDQTQVDPVLIAGCVQTPAIDVPGCFSNSGPELDLLAPGAFVTAPQIGGGVVTRAGTSMASPHALAVAIQLWQAAPSLTPAQVEATLESTGVPRTDPKNGLVHPRIDAWAAVLDAIDADGDGDLVPATIDNCLAVPNPLQENDDANFIEMSPEPYDDMTLARSDNVGNACDPDDDNDGLPDSAEGVFPMPGCASASAPTSPRARDSDGDRILDGAECALGANPTDKASLPSLAACGATNDADNDGIRAYREFCYYNTNPNMPDTDLDGENDGCEVMSFNDDAVVNVIDFRETARHFGLPYGAPGPTYLVNFDVTKDGAVNVIDLQQVLGRFAQCKL